MYRSESYIILTFPMRVVLTYMSVTMVQGKGFATDFSLEYKDSEEGNYISYRVTLDQEVSQNKLYIFKALTDSVYI